MKKTINYNSGITLLTLTITIVLMLILSFTASINVSIYFERKQKSYFETDLLKLQEEVNTYYSINNSLPIINEYTNIDMLEKNINDNNYYYVIDLSKLNDLDLNYGKDYYNIVDKEEQIRDLLDIYIINEQSHTIYYPKGIEYSGKKYYTSIDNSNTKIEDVKLSGIDITGEKAGKINNKIQLIATPLPKFAEYSGVTWSSENENIATVDENGLVTLKSEGKTIITATSKDDATITKNYEVECYIIASYKNPYIPVGFKHKEGQWYNGYTIIGETQNKNDEFVWVPCVLNETEIKEEDKDKVVIYQKITTGKYNPANYQLLPADTNVKAEDETVSEIRTSVGIYGGFYIAKYEAGVPLKLDGSKETTANSRLSTKIKTDGSAKPLSQVECGVFNYISREDALKVSKAMIDNTNTGAKSTLISGEAWDTTLAWITKTADSTYAENSEGKGWFSSDKEHTTGYYGVNTNNIFDMAGNAFELTSENNKNENGLDCQVIRGGIYIYTSCPAAWRSCYEGGLSGYGFRVVIYK